MRETQPSTTPYLRLRLRKAFSLGDFGAPKMSAGLPCSTMTPPSMKIIRSATSRAKPISCVTTIIVMTVPRERLHNRQDFADEFGVERGGDLVEKHHLGFHRQGARDSHALLLSAGQLGRICAFLFG